MPDKNREKIKIAELEYQGYKKIGASNFSFPTQEGISYTETLYNANPDTYIKSDCYNNTFRVIVDEEFAKRVNAEDADVRACYGFICSGIPNIDGVALAHSWVEFNNNVIDVSVLSGDYPIDSMKNFIYISREKLGLQDFFIRYSNDFDRPEELLTNDREFIEEIKRLGYTYLE